MEDFDTWMRNTGKWRPKPKATRRVLTQEGEDLQAEYDAVHPGGCYCAVTTMPPCSACTHPGNPISIEETEELWEYVEVED